MATGGPAAAFSSFAVSQEELSAEPRKGSKAVTRTKGSEALDEGIGDILRSWFSLRLAVTAARASKRTERVIIVGNRIFFD
ncbi:MAG: hypothetical protein Kow00107_04730 [Planctomycetota bacterium]